MRIKTFALLIMIAFGIIFVIIGIGRQDMYSVASTHLGMGFIGCSVGLLLSPKFRDGNIA